LSDGKPSAVWPAAFLFAQGRSPEVALVHLNEQSANVI
jgi:hypothetical protein